MQLKVLIVEDEALIAMDLEDILTDAGHVVVEIADNMHGALAVAAQHPSLDIAIMDIDLAMDTSGIETAKCLREDYNVGSLFVSGRVDEETQAMALEWQPIGFVGKPFRSEQILKALTQPRAG